MEIKKCSSCGSYKNVTKFYKDSGKSSGYDCRCKDCERKRYRLRRQRNKDSFKRKDRRYYEKHRDKISNKRKDWYRKNKHKILAYEAVKRALYKGDLVRMPCEVCGSMSSEAHHEDYTKPLEVKWLCRKHHLRVHGGNED